MKRALAVGLLGVVLVAASTAAAHRGHASLTVVEIDARTGAVTITHRMAAHDVEPALVDLAPDAQPSLDDPEALAALVAHGSRAFLLADDSGPVALTHAKTDLAGDDVRLVYTGRLAPPAKSVTVDSALLEQTHDDQENQVNVRRAKVTKTALFRRDQAPQRISFD